MGTFGKMERTITFEGTSSYRFFLVTVIIMILIFIPLTVLGFSNTPVMGVLGVLVIVALLMVPPFLFYYIRRYPLKMVIDPDGFTLFYNQSGKNRRISWSEVRLFEPTGRVHLKNGEQIKLTLLLADNWDLNLPSFEGRGVPVSATMSMEKNLRLISPTRNPMVKAIVQPDGVYMFRKKGTMRYAPWDKVNAVYAESVQETKERRAMTIRVDADVEGLMVLSCTYFDYEQMKAIFRLICRYCEFHYIPVNRKLNW